MPFDPRIVRIDDEVNPACDSLHDQSALHDGLPPELADLATKLQADAAWLAGVYPVADFSAPPLAPAKLPQAEGRAPVRWSRSAWSQLALVLLLISAGGGGAWWWQRAGEQATPATQLAIHPAMTASPHAAEPSLPVMLPAGPSAGEANFLWREATGPELEGLLDLMEDDALPDSVVSL
jgi:hypothetical protein